MKTGLGRYRPHRAVVGGFSPNDITGCIEWWDPTDVASITAAATLVSQINGQKGVHNLAQGTGARQPKTGTRTLNSLNVLDFDGGDVLTKNISGTPIAQPYSIVLSFILDVTSGTPEMWGYGGGAASSFRVSGGNWAVFQGSGVYTAGAADTSAHTAIVTFDGAGTNRIAIDSATGSTPADGGTSGQPVAIGMGAQPDTTGAIDGAIGWYAIYDHNLTAPERTAVYDGFKAKWGTP